MNVEALTKLAELLDHVAEIQDAAEKKMPQFDMSSWANIIDKGAENLCGTSACACGHAALDPWFIERGFTLVFYPDNAEDGAEYITISGIEDFLKYVKESRDAGRWSIMYDNVVDFGAVQHFFKIKGIHADKLFGGYLRAPREVANAVRLLMNDEEAFNLQFGIKDYDDRDYFDL